MSYNSVKKSLIEIKNDIKRHPLGTGGILLLIVLVVIGKDAITAFINHYVSKYTDSSFVSSKNIYKPPQLELNYTKQSENKNLEKNGVYETEFLLSVHQPPGNYQLGFNINTNMSNAECTKPQSLGSQTMTEDGISSSTFTYSVKCTSYKPIIDNNRLFSVK